VIVQNVSGHADPRTTARYDPRSESVKRESMAKLHVPYWRRQNVKPQI